MWNLGYHLLTYPNPETNSKFAAEKMGHPKISFRVSGRVYFGLSPPLCQQMQVANEGLV